jgi:hypothetical protein
MRPTAIAYKPKMMIVLREYKGRASALDKVRIHREHKRYIDVRSDL